MERVPGGFAGAFAGETHFPTRHPRKGAGPSPREGWIANVGLAQGSHGVTCRELADFILDYVSGELPAPARAEFDHHLRKCLNCCRYLASYQQSVRMGQRAFEEEDDAEVPPEVPHQLITAILAARRRLASDSRLH